MPSKFLPTGEFMQLGSRENENERFAHYLRKTFKKTASLIANSCKAVSVAKFLFNYKFMDCLQDTSMYMFHYFQSIMGRVFQSAMTEHSCLGITMSIHPALFIKILYSA